MLRPSNLLWAHWREQRSKVLLLPEVRVYVYVYVYVCKVLLLPEVRSNHIHRTRCILRHVSLQPSPLTLTLTLNPETSTLDLDLNPQPSTLDPQLQPRPHRSPITLNPGPNPGAQQEQRRLRYQHPPPKGGEARGTGQQAVRCAHRHRRITHTCMCIA